MNILYAITDSHLMPGQTLFSSVKAALVGGCRRIQYRDKSSDSARRFAEATQLLELCETYNAELLINDDVLLAKKIGAHGVHLGQTDGSVSAARKLLGDSTIIGVTCHASMELARNAVNDGATYVAFGRFFPSTTKPDAPPAPLSLLGNARREFAGIPIIAIGGITLENAPSVLAAGATMIAASFSLFGVANIEQRARAFCDIQPSAFSSG
jgi:thiamine-phosphate pyrophosphorylase